MRTLRTLLIWLSLGNDQTDRMSAMLFRDEAVYGGNESVRMVDNLGKVTDTLSKKVLKLDTKLHSRENRTVIKTNAYGRILQQKLLDYNIDILETVMTDIRSKKRLCKHGR